MEALLYVLRIACLVMLLAGVLPMKTLADLPRRLSTSRPNIVLILTDDQDLLLGTINYMPNLAANVTSQGVTFSSFAVPTSLCTPSRAILLTGQYAHNNGIVQNSPPLGGFEKMIVCGFEDATVATALQDAGYRTVLVGKYVNGYPLLDDPTYIAPGWSEWFVPTRDAYGYYDYQLNENGVLVDYAHTRNDYLTDVLASKAMGFITRTVTLSPMTPFFAMISMYAPHEPAVPAPRHYSWFPDEQAPRTPNFNEEDMSDKPVQMHSLPLLTEADIQSIDVMYRKRLRSLQSVDEMIAQLTQTLDGLGVLDNTYIVFASDNGYVQGQHRFISGKGTPYEENFRVPLIVRGPGVTPGVVRDELAAMVDLAPTFAAIAGTDMPISVDGRSLLPLLEGSEPSPPWRQAQLMEHWSVASEQWIPVNVSATPLGPDETPPVNSCANTAVPKWKGLEPQVTSSLNSTASCATNSMISITIPTSCRVLIDAVEPEYLSQLTSWIAAYYACVGSVCETAGAMQPPPMALRCYDPDGNGQIDIIDVQAVTAHWMLTAADPGYDPRYDPSGDGLISTLDFTLVARGWGQACPG